MQDPFLANASALKCYRCGKEKLPYGYRGSFNGFARDPNAVRKKYGKGGAGGLANHLVATGVTLTQSSPSANPSSH
jgi:hypothetical protein